jgi:serine/threonine protein kinase
VYGYAESGGRPVVEMEYAAGCTLEGRLGTYRMAPAEAARLAAVLAWAVHAAHEKGIVHRDLKPANVLMGAAVPGNPGNVPGGFPKISDFGLAALSNATQGQTESGSLLGTPHYMSPEQAAGKTREVGPATDVWALGVLLYRCLAGRLPLQGASVLLDTLERIKTMQMRPLREAFPDVSAELEEVCMACLRRAPGERPTAAVLAARLEQLAGTGPQREKKPVKQVHPARRRWLAAGLAAGLLVLGVWLAVHRPAGDGAHKLSCRCAAP